VKVVSRSVQAIKALPVNPLASAAAPVATQAPAATPSTTAVEQLKNGVTATATLPRDGILPVQLRMTQGTLRTQAPWSARSREMASEALRAARGTQGDARVAAAVHALLGMKEVASAVVSLNVARVNGGGEVTSAFRDVRLNPASNSKIATATFALGVLGPEHRFKTTISSDAAGNVYLKGGFDPSLTRADLDGMARALAASGVREIRGDMLVDDGALQGSRVPRHFEEFGDEDWEYLAHPEAFSVDKNLVRLEVEPGAAPGVPARVTSSVACFDIRSTATTAPARQEFKLGCDEQDRSGVLTRNARGQAIIDVKGTIAADYVKGKSLLMKSPAPEESAADHLRQAFSDAGIVVKGRVGQGNTPAGATLLHEHASAPLADLLKTSIATSNAFDHEMYCLATSAALSPGGTTSIERATGDLHAFLEKTLGLEGFRMDNASGLGDANRLSSADMTALLANASHEPRYASILAGLATPGGAGTLHTRMLDTPAEGRLRAKTGTLNNSVALSGVVDGAREQFVFSALVNGRDGKPVGRTAARSFVDALGMVLATLA
jgi:D-alanyl-D-alanine carboxypeptidase/D-alanyl-D-alanine-endopeptidase (penicillin-binding protein 4)